MLVTGSTIKVLRDGENVLSRDRSTRVYGLEVVKSCFQEKLGGTLNQIYLYQKPTQVGRLSKLRGAR